MSTPEQEFVDDRELARHTPITRKTWQAWRLSGKGPPYRKVGRRCIYRWSEVAGWLDGRTVGVKA
jgi:hypothetical protein